jgi:hypothetical protein
VAKLREVKRRTKEGESGFDAVGIIGIDLRNDGTPVQLFELPPIPQPGDIYHYEQMVHRLAHLYEQKFAKI